MADLTAAEVRASSVAEIEGYIARSERQIDQVDRRLAGRDTIAHDEKVFSIFEEHTRWIAKGKAGGSAGGEVVCALPVVAAPPSLPFSVGVSL